MVTTSEKIPPTFSTITVTWEKPPSNFLIDEEPVENIDHPLIAGALRELLELADYIKPDVLIAGNLGVTATVNERLVVKAPDWFYAKNVQPMPPHQIRTTYTPHVEGDRPLIVMEFLSNEEGGEYSIKRTHPPGKWFFYEQILQVPNYVIFDPQDGLLEMYRRQNDNYKLELPDENGQHWIEELELFLGTWQGEKEGRTGYWLRFWDKDGHLLLWGTELLAQKQAQMDAERQRADTERQRAETERQRADRLADYLRSQGIDPETI